MSDAPDRSERPAVSDRPESWPVHEVDHIWRGAAPFSVRRDTISAPARPEERFGRLVLEHPGAVVVLAVDEQERALVLHQYRHPALLRFVELPAGLLDVEGEDPVEAAKRELQEEGLVVAERWTHLFTTYSSPGLSSEKIAYYLAEGLSAAVDRGGFEPAHEELDMTLEWVPVDDLLAGVREGRVTDGPTAQAVLGYVVFHRSARAAR
jgi:ADP-ribose pyrophosphatase